VIQKSPEDLNHHPKWTGGNDLKPSYDPVRNKSGKFPIYASGKASASKARDVFEINF